MPEMSGEEVLARLRTSNPQVNVLTLSGYSITHERFAGKAEVLHKPLSIKILANKIRDSTRARCILPFAAALLLPVQPRLQPSGEIRQARLVDRMRHIVFGIEQV